MTRINLIILLLLLCGCRESGFIAKDAPEWDRALERARKSDQLDPDCRDDGVVYRLLSDEEWDYDPATGGHTDGGLVEVRQDGFKGYSRSLILEHEFLHCILECSGEGDIQNHAHWGAVWDGLRADGS